MSKIIDFPGETLSEIPTNLVLEAAKGKLETVIVIGLDADGNEYFASSTSYNAHVIWLMECIKNNILNGVYNG